MGILPDEAQIGFCNCRNAIIFLRLELFYFLFFFAIIASVGVWTLPQDNWALCLVVRARVAFIPTIQSASALATAEANRFSYSLPSFRFSNPSLIALSVTEEIQSRLTGFFTFAFSRIQRATSSLHGLHISMKMYNKNTHNIKEHQRSTLLDFLEDGGNKPIKSITHKYKKEVMKLGRYHLSILYK